MYTTSQGRTPFSEWLSGLRDTQARAKIKTKLERAEAGNLGTLEGVGEGVHELKVNYGPGYRIYFGNVNETIILLLCGGDKDAQDADIQTARLYWKDYKRRQGNHETSTVS